MMKKLFLSILCILAVCMSATVADAEEKVTREQVDTLVSRVFRRVMLMNSFYDIVRNDDVEADKALREYLTFEMTSDAVYDEWKDLPAADFKDKIHFTGSYVYCRLTTREFWNTFRTYVDKAEQDNKFDYTIRDKRYSALVDVMEEDYTDLMRDAVAQARIPLYNTGIYTPKDLKISHDKLPVLLVKTLMEYFSYDEFIGSHPECWGIHWMIGNKSVEPMSILIGRGYGKAMGDTVLNSQEKLDRMAEYMKLSRGPLYVTEHLYRPTAEVKLKQGLYNGETYDGRPDGEGTLIDKKGVKYFGSFRNGLRHGPVFVFRPKKDMEMQFWYKGRQRKDIRTGPSQDGVVPEAMVIEGKRFGYGCCFYDKTKTTYSGLFTDGQLSGPGSIISQNSTVKGLFNGNMVRKCIAVRTGSSIYKENKFVGTQQGELRKGVLRHVRSKDNSQQLWVGEFISETSDGETAWSKISGNDTTWRDGIFAYGNQYGHGSLKRSVVHEDGKIEKLSYEGTFVKNDPWGKGSAEIVLSSFAKDKFSINRFGLKLYNICTDGKDTVVVNIDGIFKDGKLVKGKVSMSNGNFMVGRFADGAIAEGRMIKRYSDGSSYDGECVNGKYNGYGKIIYPDGTVYEGMFKDGAPVAMERNYYVPTSELVNLGKKTRSFRFDNLSDKKGVASLVRAAGVKIVVREMSSVYVTCVGRFKDDVMTIGKVTVSDGTWMEGSFEDGVLISGKGRTIDKYGTIYTGDIRNGFPHGEGECLYKDGTVFKGRFAKGNRMQGTHYTVDGEVIKVYN